MALTRQVTFVSQGKVDDRLPVEELAAFDASGTPVTVGGSGGASYTLPAATANALGGVKLQVFGEAIGNASENVAVAAADAPTKTEYDALVASYNALAKQFNRLISGLASSGVIQVPSGK
ncbi:hypothetical protein [uncultured Bifidobacterium sp.]|uniref:hypothetical protein n=1 Tax=uncultured Bifidobacterium sp. TaxID=165187 RepID=UPI002630BC20|nr:hypothetical protein [uncultured Bifidobacterium sp.]